MDNAEIEHLDNHIQRIWEACMRKFKPIDNPGAIHSMRDFAVGKLHNLGFERPHETYEDDPHKCIRFYIKQAALNGDDSVIEEFVHGLIIYKWDLKPIFKQLFNQVDVSI